MLTLYLQDDAGTLQLHTQLLSDRLKLSYEDLLELLPFKMICFIKGNTVMDLQV